MRKGLSGGAIAAVLVVILVLVSVGAGIGTYNGMAQAREGTLAAQSAIDTQLQRRAELIPNLVNTVKGFAAQEQALIDSVTQARAQLVGAQTMQEKADADAELSGALSRLLLIVENYPELKSDKTYIGLMDELAGTENRIAVARNDYNAAALAYNNRIIRFPGNLLAGMMGFERAQYFEATPGAQQPPVVDFS